MFDYTNTLVLAWSIFFVVVFVLPKVFIKEGSLSFSVFLGVFLFPALAWYLGALPEVFVIDKKGKCEKYLMLYSHDTYTDSAGWEYLIKDGEWSTAIINTTNTIYVLEEIKYADNHMQSLYSSSPVPIEVSKLQIPDGDVGYSNNWVSYLPDENPPSSVKTSVVSVAESKYWLHPLN